MFYAVTNSSERFNDINILCGKTPGLKTSTCQYSFTVIVPPAGSRRFVTYKLLICIDPILTTLKANCPWFAVSLKLPAGGEPGCEGPFNAACSFTLLYFTSAKMTKVK